MPDHSKKSTTIIKIIALLSLVRWYNVLLVGIALFLSAVFLLNINTTVGWRDIIVDYRIYFEIIAISFLIQAGYLINAFYAKHDKPENLILIFSNPRIDSVMSNPPKHFDRTFNNVSKDSDIAQNCTGQKCVECMICYKPESGVNTIVEAVK